MTEKRKTILDIISRMHEKDVIWAISCSGAMFFDGVWDEMNDFDILVEWKSLPKFLEIFKEMGGQIIEGQNGKESYFDSKFFGMGKLNDVDIDIISEFTITTFNTRYCYALKEEHIRYCNCQGKNIPIIPMEANMCLYGMMINWQARRRFKYELCRDYLKQEGVLYPDLLKDESLPTFMKRDIVNL